MTTDASSTTQLLPGPILVFDSGVGGLSIVQALRERMPELPLAYACDNAAFPYGLKTDAWLKERVPQVIGELIQRINPCMLVIACNTASTVVLPELRERFQLPVVGVVPAIKPAALMTRSGHIGLLATQGTIQRTYTQELIATYASDCEVTRVGSNELVQLAEASLAGQPPDKKALLAILAPLLEQPRLDTVILGCTHFPLLQKELAAVAKEAGAAHWQWIDSGAAIARRVFQLLSEAGYANPCCVDTYDQGCWLTGPLPADSQLPAALEWRGFAPLMNLDLPLEADLNTASVLSATL
ncbi:glutamate racemase [Marinospirillum perlucidum]|uniref:glutamate racemase n=1 Tax=Marinospirillum perlucidum TaxID=1982602 RepID=UPI0015B329D0|nr:glutamate racemase [Marinospirillum perlucidum]